MGDASRTDSKASASEVPPEPTPPSEAASSASETTSNGEREASRERATPDEADTATVSVSSDSAAQRGERETRETRETRDVPGLPRTTVRITADIGEIVGADDRDYDLGAEDVVTLPEPNADVLVEKNAAERLQ